MADKKYRDSVFRHFFITDKKRLASLLRAVPGVECDNPDEIEIQNLEAAMLSSVQNDVACIWRGQLFVLTEHQSTLNENMPLRFLFYTEKMLRKLIGDAQHKYRTRLIMFPKMRFYVLYNGKYPAPERRLMRLSDAFGGDDALELKVEFINLNAGFNRELIARSESLSDYCNFVDMVESRRRGGVELRVALRESIDYCIANGIMADYFQANYWEVVAMYEDDYDAELAGKARFEEGEEQGKLTMIQNFYKAGTPLELIMTATGWTKEQILAAVSEPSIG